MGTLELIRKFSFLALDFLKGMPVKKHYDDIKFILENYDYWESVFGKMVGVYIVLLSLLCLIKKIY